MKQLALVVVFLGTVLLLNAGFSPKLFLVCIVCLLGIIFLNIIFNAKKSLNPFSPNRDEHKETASISIQLVVILVVIVLIFLSTLAN